MNIKPTHRNRSNFFRGGVFVFILFLLGSSHFSFAQSNCGSSVPTVSVDLSANPDTTWTSASITRSGQCCSVSSNKNCVHFTVKLNSRAAGLQFDGVGGLGATYYHVNCTDSALTGRTMCLSGTGTTWDVVFCKPGTNTQKYTITSIPAPRPKKSTVYAAVGCSLLLQELSLQESTITWTCPTNSTYLSYLSCTSGCDSTWVNLPSSGYPSYIDYVVSGTPTSNCLGSTWSDTIRVYTASKLKVTIAPDSAFICTGDTAAHITATTTGGYRPYTYSWNNGKTDSSIWVHAGTYILTVTDNKTTCTAKDTVVVKNATKPTPSISGSSPACKTTTYTYSVTSASYYTYAWSVTGGTLNSGQGTNSISVTWGSGSSGSINITVTDTRSGCVGTGSTTITLNSLPAITSNPKDSTLCATNNASFSVTATGTSLTYQWQEFNGTAWSNLSGETSPTLSLTNVPYSKNGYQYRCVVSGFCNPSVTSTAATMTVIDRAAISTQPSNSHVCAGATATFTISATGAGLTYAWRESLNGGSTWGAAGSSTNSLSVTGVTTSMNGRLYQCVITGTCNTVTSNNVSLTVDTLPAITADPSGTTICPGDNTSFSVSAVGTGKTYQWQEYNGSSWSDITGATSSTLSLTSVPYSKNGYQYRAVVSGTCSPAATSAAATLTVRAVAAITTQPSNAVVCAGATATYTVSATGAGLTYLWRESLNGGATWGAAGSTTNSFSVSGVTTSMNGRLYQCVITGTCNTVTTNNVSLHVDTLPAITSQPSSSTICAGNNTSFSVTAVGTGKTYQWQEYNGSSWSDISGQTASTLSMSGVSDTKNGYQYRVIVSGTCSPALTSNAATLTVRSLATINTQPSNAVVCAGDTATYSVSASGTGISYQWRESTNGGVTWGTVGTSSILKVAPTTVSMNGRIYQCIIAGTCNTVTTNNVTLTVDTLPSVTNPTDSTICAGNNVSFTVTAAGTGKTYQWQEYNGSVWSNVTGATSATLNLTSVAVSKNGFKYRCVVSGTCPPAATSSAATLTVNTSPVITSQPPFVTVCAGQTASFSVTATGAGLTYQWQLNTGSGYTDISGATSSTYNRTNVPANGNGDYVRCVVSGTCPPSVISNGGFLTVYTAPSITVQPVNTAVCDGYTASFALSATGTTISYQWQENTGSGWADISGATSSTLSLGTVTTSQNGNQYRCNITGVCSPNATSNVVTLTVNPLPTTPPINHY